MLNASIVKMTSFHSAIGNTSVLVPNGEKKSRNIVADLLLTALIDAFSILVIFRKNLYRNVNLFVQKKSLRL